MVLISLNFKNNYAINCEYLRVDVNNWCFRIEGDNLNFFILKAKKQRDMSDLCDTYKLINIVNHNIIYNTAMNNGSFKQIIVRFFKLNANTCLNVFLFRNIIFIQIRSLGTNLLLSILYTDHSHRNININRNKNIRCNFAKKYFTNTYTIYKLNIFLLQYNFPMK